jgi:uncharacterized membrane protein
MPGSLLAGLKARLRGLRYGFLVLPGALALGFIGLAFALVAVDRASGEDGMGFGVADDPQAARTVLTVIAGSLITVAGVTFSITMVTLQLVSQQFSPRALRGFLGDRVNQAVAGVFVGIFVYCLIVLRTVSTRESGAPFVPALSTTAAIVLAVVALGLLLVFIDHMGRNIQVSTIAAGIAQGTLRSLDELYPAASGEPGGEDPRSLVRAWEAEAEPRLVHPQRPGAVQSIILDDVPRHVGSPGLRIEVRVAPGDFVTEADALVAYWPGRDDGDVERALRLAVVVANERDMRQDPGYGLRQLADIATRAISPAINDPTTAWTCIQYLGAIMERLAGLPFPGPVRRYEDPGVTVVARQQTFEEYLDAAYVQIARYASDPRVAGALLESLARVADAARRAGAHGRAAAVLATAERVAASPLGGQLTDADRDDLQARLEAVRSGAAAVAAG